MAVGAEQTPVENQPKPKPKMRTWIIAAVVAVVVVAGAVYVAVAGLPGTEGNVVARVNGEAITKAALYEELERQAGSRVLQQLIAQRLVEQEMARSNTQVQEKDVRAELERVRDQFPSADAFKAALEQYGLTEQDLVKEVRFNLGLKALGRRGITVSDDEMRKYFDENKDDLGQPEQVHARHILVSSKEKADDLVKQIKAGAAFEDLAKKESLDSGTSGKGGDLGFIRRGATVEPFEKVAFELAAGSIGVAETPYGFHVIQVLEKKKAEPAVYDQVKDKIQETLMNQKAKTADQILTELNDAARVDAVWARSKSLGHEPKKSASTGANP